MRSSLLVASLVVNSLCLAVPALAADASSSSLQVTSTLKIPGATLQPGTWKVSLEDRLSDRAIVRITSSTSDTHYLLLTVPSSRLGSPTNGEFLYFQADDNAQALRGWKCSDCSTALEFVYPKLEAVALTGTSANPVMAVDPAYDKLPGNLSSDDMKVVTLWLVSPESVTADNKGHGVKAAKLADIPATETADASQSTTKPAPVVDAPAVAAAPATEVAAVRATPRHLPRTATNTYALLVSGLFLLIGAGALRFRNAYNS